MLNANDEEIEIDDESLRPLISEYARLLQLAVATNMLDADALGKIQKQVDKDYRILYDLATKIEELRGRVVVININAKEVETLCAPALIAK
jgi:hypothetical protein